MVAVYSLNPYQDIALDFSVFFPYLGFMKIENAIHALILQDQKKLLPRKSKLKTSNGKTFLFVKVDTQLNWPRIIVEDDAKNEFVWNGMEVRKRDLKILDQNPTVEIFYEAP